MKFIIDGHEFEGVNLERVPAWVTLALPKQAGLGLPQLVQRMSEMPRLGRDASGQTVVLDEDFAATTEGRAQLDGKQIMESEPHLRAFFAYLWVSRMLAGERGLTFDQACEFEFQNLETVDDEDEPEDVAPDPSQPGSDPVAEDAAAV